MCLCICLYCRLQPWDTATFSKWHHGKIPDYLPAQTSRQYSWFLNDVLIKPVWRNAREGHGSMCQIQKDIRLACSNTILKTSRISLINDNWYVKEAVMIHKLWGKWHTDKTISLIAWRKQTHIQTDKIQDEWRTYSRFNFYNCFNTRFYFLLFFNYTRYFCNY